MMGFASAVDGWASLAIAVTWQLAALALVAWVCEKVFRLRQPRARHALWWFVLIAPLVVTPGRMALQRRQAMISVRAPAAAVKVVTWQLALRPMPEPPAAAAMPPALPVGRFALPKPALRPVNLLGLAWLAGCAALALRLAVGHRRVRRLLAGSMLTEMASAREVLSDLCARAGVEGEVALRVSEAVGSPVLYGWRRPTIMVPTGWLESLAVDELRAMLAHEVAHVRRRDFLTNTVQRLIEIPLFFHPGVWLASRRIALAREELCDAWALSLGTDAASYARSLAVAAERTQSAFAPVSLGIAESRSTLLRRVEAIMTMGNVRRMSRPLLVAVIAVGLVSAIAFAAVQVRGQAESSAAGADRSEIQQLLGEMKNLAIAMQMYVKDSGGLFPPTDDIKQIQVALAPYMGMGPQRIFTRKLRYVMPAGIGVAQIESPSSTPLAIADDDPRETVIGYADGHVDSLDRARYNFAGRVIELTVVSDDKAPMAGVEIRMLGDSRAVVLKTDEKGRCKSVLEGATTGDPTFHVRSADGRLERIVTVPLTGERQEKTVTLGSLTAKGNIVSFSGRVVDERGRPVGGARLWVYGFDNSLSHMVFLSRELGVTREDGTFSAEIPHLAVGNQGWGGGWIDPWVCQVIAHKPGHGPGWVTVEGRGSIDAGKVTLARQGGLRGTVRDVDGKLLSKVSVRVTVVEAAAASLHFGGMATVPPWAEARTDAKGRFSFADLPAGGVVKLDITTCGAGESYRDGQMSPDLGKITLATRQSDLDIQLVRQPVVEGMLLAPSPGKKPASGVKVMLNGPIKGQPNSIFGDSTVTDEKGRYRFTLSVAGTWTLSVADTRFSGVLAKDLKVDLGQHVAIPTTVLQASAIIRGRVLDALTGAPVSNVHVTCNSAESSAPAGPPTTETGATTALDGSFEVGGPPGKDVLSLGGPPAGYTWSHLVRKEMGGGRLQVKVTENPDKPSMRILAVKPGQRLTGVDLFVAHEATVTGVVLGPDGSPWQPKGFQRGGYVRGDLDRELVTSTTWPPLGSRVEQDGTFSLRYFYGGVPSVLMVVDEEEGLGGAARVTPELGTPKRVTIRMSPMATITGRAVMPDGSPAIGASVGAAGAIAGTTDKAGRFLLKRGILSLPMSVAVYVPAPPSDGNGTSWPRYSGESKWFEARPGEKTVDVGDIALQLSKPPRS
jgi:beta-lactamase regulating signal transducer with metallopeptidase domain